MTLCLFGGLDDRQRSPPPPPPPPPTGRRHLAGHVENPGIVGLAKSARKRLGLSPASPDSPGIPEGKGHSAALLALSVGC